MVETGNGDDSGFLGCRNLVSRGRTSGKNRGGTNYSVREATGQMRAEQCRYEILEISYEGIECSHRTISGSREAFSVQRRDSDLSDLSTSQEKEIRGFSTADRHVPHERGHKRRDIVQTYAVNVVWNSAKF